MRNEASITAISWIPSEAVPGAMKLPFSVGAAHYDTAPPDRIAGLGELVALRDADRFRFANRLEAWIETDGERITAHGQRSAGMIGSTTVKLGASVTVAAVALPDIEHEPEVGDGFVRFRLTSGGRTGVPAPRRVNRPPFVQVAAPLAWSTVELTLHVDGRRDHALVGASPFPRHWAYDSEGALMAKSGMIDFKEWYRKAFGKHSPWGDEDSPALATAVETALERQLSARIMRGGRKPRIKSLEAGRAFCEQGDPGNELFLLLDGVLAVEVDGERVAELGPGSVGGERALLEGGRRTCTLRALTPAKVAVARAVEVEPGVLEQLREGHRREQQSI
jgi:hypothetical protein